MIQPVRVAARSKAGVCGSLLAGISVSNPTGGMSVCCEYCVLSGRGICVGLITHLEESYRVWSVWVKPLKGRSWARIGSKGYHRKKIIYYRGRVIVVTIATGLRGRLSGFSIPCGARNWSYLQKTFRQSPGPSRRTIQWVLRAFSRG